MATEAGSRRARPAPPAQRRGDALRVLVVDDSPIGLKLARLLLELEGHAVVEATSAEDAFRIVQRQRPDVVLTDIQLPGMDGLEFVQRLRRAAVASGRPSPLVVAMTGSIDAPRERFLRWGFDDFLPKPVQRGRLRQVLAALTTPGHPPAGPPAAPSAPRTETGPTG